MGVLDPYVIIPSSDKESIDKVVKVLKDITNAFQNPSVLKMYKELCGQNDKSKYPFKAKGIGKALKKCLVSHRFTEAAKLMECLSCENGNNEIIFKAGSQVLENHPNATPEKMLQLMCHTLSFHCLFRSEVALEAAIYYIKRKEFSQAQNCIQEIRRAKWHSCMRTDPLIEGLFEGYDGLLSYIEWTEMKSGNISRSLDTKEQNLQNVADKAITSFTGLLSQKGPWDIFVVKLVEILEYYNRLGEAEEALMQYKERNPLHIHCYIYLYEFYQNHNYRQEKQIQCLKEIVDLCPSNSRVLDYISIAKENEADKCIPIIFNYLNYASNKNDLTAWLHFVGLLKDVLKRNTKEELHSLRGAWEQHKSFWPAYQFSASSVQLTNEESAALAVAKATAVYILEEGEDDHPFICEVQRKLNSSTLYSHLQLELTQNLDTVCKLKRKLHMKRKHSNKEL